MMNTFQSQLPKLIFLILIWIIISCNQKQNQKILPDAKTEDSMPNTAQQSEIYPNEKSIAPFIDRLNLLPYNSDVKLLEFTYKSSMKSPGDKDYKRLTESRDMQIISRKKINDSTLLVKTDAVLCLQSFKGGVGCSNDTIYLSIDRDTNKGIAAAFIQYAFEYTIRIKKGKRYKLAIFKSRYPVTQK